MLAQPQDLAEAEDGLQRQASDGEEPVGADMFVEPLCFGLRTPVEPGDRLIGRLTVGVEGEACFAGAGHGDRDDAVRVIQLADGLADRLGRFEPILRGVMVGPGWAWIDSRGGDTGAGDYGAGAVEDDSLDVGRAEIDADQQRLTRHRCLAFLAFDSNLLL